MKWNEGLQGPALEIAASTATVLWVAAGPGTGKTTTLMRRLARLMEVDGVAPQRILVCTFTRTAAADLARSVADLGIPGVDSVRAQTLHALCFSILSKQEILQLTGRVPRPLFQFEERFLLQDMARGGHGGVRVCRKQLKAFSGAWARLQHEEPGWPKSKADQRFQTALNSWLSFHRAMLLGEIIPEALRYLRLNPASSYRLAFDHVLVDEYQDLNKAEQELVELLAPRSLAVIGDEDQAIYTFKHAHPEGIVEFPLVHPHAQTAQLSDCRRCPREVVLMANALIANNPSRSCRSLLPWPENPGGEVFTVQWSDMAGEAEGMSRFIKSRIDAGSISPGDVLVLAPRRDFGYLMRDELEFLGVPARSFFTEQLFEGDPRDVDACASQQSLSLLALLADATDAVALRCWCGYGHNDLASSAWARLRQHCEESGDSPWVALERLEAGDLKLPYTKVLIPRFAALKTELVRLLPLHGDELLGILFPPESEWARPFREVREGVEGTDLSAGQLLEILERNILRPEMPATADYVRVMSLHKSKGLTAFMVIVIGCIDGLMPTVDEDATPVGRAKCYEEQRRLFYVAITRTKGTLILSSVTRLPRRLAHRIRARVVSRRGAFAPTITSPFVGELGPGCPRAIRGDEFLALTGCP